MIYEHRQTIYNIYTYLYVRIHYVKVSCFRVFETSLHTFSCLESALRSLTGMTGERALCIHQRQRITRGALPWTLCCLEENIRIPEDCPAVRWGLGHCRNGKNPVKIALNGAVKVRLQKKTQGTRTVLRKAFASHARKKARAVRCDLMVPGVSTVNSNGCWWVFKIWHQSRGPVYEREYTVNLKVFYEMWNSSCQIHPNMCGSLKFDRERDSTNMLESPEGFHQPWNLHRKTIMLLWKPHSKTASGRTWALLRAHSRVSPRLWTTAPQLRAPCICRFFLGENRVIVPFFLSLIIYYFIAASSYFLIVDVFFYLVAVATTYPR